LRICAAVTFARIHLISLLPQFIAEHAQSAGDDDALFHPCIALYRCILALGEIANDK